MDLLSTIVILDAKRPPTSPANQEAAYVHRLDAGVVIRSVESSGASNLRVSEASFVAFGGSWGFLGASWGPKTHFEAYTLEKIGGVLRTRRFF